ncbi:uncharacterized protein LOC123879808 [Maniola jurtina]|uniref:uncharacterized protein LOC123879808 n=1 Tax=Maniola jurtina TaxID=191418 RepID=UPI001E68A60A|nr:uncharacterized protein LOC123879808 [Maniola jurtina]
MAAPKATLDSSSGSEDTVKSEGGEEHITIRKKRAHRVVASPSEYIKIRIPPFWPEDPELWFAQIEGQFEIAGVVSENTKFFYITSSLSNQYSKEVKDIITSPPESNRYTKLKEELIKRLSASRDRKIQQLLKHEELGNRKPSQFLRHLIGLAGSSVPEDFIKSIWCSRLPASIQTLIASQPAGSLEDLADLADRVCDIVSPSPQVSTSSAAPTTSVHSVESMALEIAELKEAVKNLTMQLNRRDRQPRRRQTERSTSRRRNRSQSSYRKYPACWYHAKFGSNATKCVKPCNFASENQQSGR